MIEASVYIGLAFGSISASFLFPKIGAKYLFVLSASIIVFATLYIMLFVKESLNEDQISTNFNHFGAIPIVKAALQRRRSYDRFILWLLISIYVMNVIVIGKYHNFCFFSSKSLIYHRWTRSYLLHIP